MSDQRRRRRKEGESKEDRFRRLMASRVARLEDDLRLIGNLSNRAHYDWDEEEVRDIFMRLGSRLNEAKERFFPDEFHWIRARDAE